MKKFLNFILLIIICFAFYPAIANEDDNDQASSDESVEATSTEDTKDKKSFLKEKKKNKKNKGARNVKIQPSEEDDENIILELDGR